MRRPFVRIVDHIVRQYIQFQVWHYQVTLYRILYERQAAHTGCINCQTSSQEYAIEGENIPRRLRLLQARQSMRCRRLGLRVLLRFSSFQETRYSDALSPASAAAAAQAAISPAYAATQAAPLQVSEIGRSTRQNLPKALHSAAMVTVMRPAVFLPATRPLRLMTGAGLATTEMTSATTEVKRLNCMLRCGWKRARRLSTVDVLS